MPKSKRGARPVYTDDLTWGVFIIPKKGTAVHLVAAFACPKEARSFGRRHDYQRQPLDWCQVLPLGASDA